MLENINMNEMRDFDKELTQLKEEIEKLVGEDELQKITKIVEMSYQFDEKPNYKVTYNIVGEKDFAIKK